MHTYGLLYVPSGTTTTNQTVPLTRRDINITMRPTGSVVSEKMLFMNQENKELETEFRYPMKKCRINGLRFRVEDGEWQMMNVEEKMKAETTYQTAIHSGNQAVLGSQVSDDVFSIKIGRLLPYEMIWIEVNMISELDWSNCYSYRHQMTMFPPYIMDADTIKQYESKAPKFSSDETLPYGIFVSIRAEDTCPFTFDMISDTIQKDLKSNSDNILEIPRTKITGKTDITLRMTPSEIKPSVHVSETETELYYQISYGHKPNDLGMANISVSDDNLKTDKQLTNILSQYEVVDNSNQESNTIKPEDKKYAFIVDGSGSMSGEAIQNASQALKIAIKQLPVGAKYMIMVFGDNSGYGRNNSFYPSGLQDVKPVSLPPHHPNYACDGCNNYPINGIRYHMKGDENDVDFCETCFKLSGKDKSQFDLIQPETQTIETLSNIDNIWCSHTDDSFSGNTMTWINDYVSASYGGTNMSLAVDSVYDRLNANNHNVIIMMTDAGIDNSQEVKIVNKIKSSPIKAEVYGLGIGASCSMSFLEQFSNIGNGISFHVSNYDEISEKTQRLMTCSTQSQFLRNLSFETPSHVQISTRKPVNCYFFGEPLNVFLKVNKSELKDDDSVVLKSNEIPMMTIDLKTAVKSPVNLEMVYHMSYLEQLLKFPELYKQMYNLGDDDKNKMTKEEYVKTIVEIASKYNIVTPYTSAVIVRELTNSEGIKTLEKVDIPIAVGKDKTPTMPTSHVYSMTTMTGFRGASLASTPTAAVAPVSSGSYYYGKKGKHSSLARSYKSEQECEMPSTYVGHQESMSNSLDYSQQESMSAPKTNTSFYSGITDMMNSMSMPSMFSSTTSYSEDEGDCAECDEDCFDEMGGSFVDEKTTSTKTEPSLTPIQIIEQMILSQISDGHWKYDLSVLQSIMKETIDTYKAELKDVDDDVLMTLMVLSYMDNHPEHYTTYSKSYQNAEQYLTGKVPDVKTATLQLIKIGLN